MNKASIACCICVCIPPAPAGYSWPHCCRGSLTWRGWYLGSRLIGTVTSSCIRMMYDHNAVCTAKCGEQLADWGIFLSYPTIHLCHDQRSL